MATDSSVAGFLAPSASAAYDATLEDLLQAAVVGITGLPGTLVRPRWQPEPPQQPSFTTDWCAFGVMRTTVDVFAADLHDPTGNGSNKIERDEILFVLHSFYGPNAHAYCERFRDGFEIAQNRDTLTAQGLALIEVGEATVLPALLKEKWVKRVDTTVQYRRRTSRTYPVLTITQAQGDLQTDGYSVSLNVNN